MINYRRLCSEIHTLVTAGAFEQAAAELEEHRRVADQQGDVQYQAWVNFLIASFLESTGQRTASLSVYERARKLAEQANDADVIALVYNDLGYLLSELGRYQESAEWTKKALAMYRASGAMKKAAKCLNNLASVRVTLGNLNEGLALFEEALDIAKDEDYLEMQADCYSGIAGVYESRGRFDEAREAYQEALRISEESGDRHSMAVFLNNLGLVYERLGDVERAKEAYLIALNIAADIRNVDAFALVQHSIAGLEAQERGIDSAIERFRQVLKMATDLGDPALEASTLTNLGSLHHKQGRVHRAADEYSKAVHLADKLGMPEQHANSLLGFGQVLSAEGRFAKARKHLTHAEGIAQRHAFLLLESMVQDALGELYLKEGQVDEAYDRFARSIELVETIRTLQWKEESRQGFFGDQSSVYDRMVRLCVETGRPLDSWAYAERSRSRSLVDAISSSVVLRGSEVQKELRLRHESAHSRIERLTHAGADGTNADGLNNSDGHESGPDTVALQLGEAMEELRRVETRMSIDFPEFAAASLESDALSGIAEILRDEAPEGTGILEYFRTVSGTLAWMITSDGLRGPVSLDPDYERLRECVLADDGNGQPRYRLEADPVNGEQLLSLVSNQLLEPLVEEGLLRDVTNLWIVPHNVLHYIPWAALPVGGQYAIEAFREIVTLPSAVTLPFWIERRKKAPGRSNALIVYNPDGTLSGAHAEGSLIGSLYHDPTLLGEGTTTEKLSSEVEGRGIIHIAAHGEINPGAPQLSGLEMADGRMTLPEVLASWHLTAELVVLSACHLARGRVLPGDDVTALPRAILYSGAAAVTSSLYAVDDDQTSELMEAFHRKLVAGGPKGLALAEAQREAIDAGVSARVWAPFLLLGDAG